MSKLISLEDRARGALVGLAIGDALGTPLEFKEPGSFTPVTGLIGGGPFDLEPGEWTDDTSLALCLAVSLYAQKGFNPYDQMQRYTKWWKEGYMSVTGDCFDIGNTTRAALQRFKETGNPWAGQVGDPAGNGSLMRLAPVPIYFFQNKARKPMKGDEPDYVRIAEMSGESSRTTHGAPACVSACRHFGVLIAAALRGVGKDELLSPGFEPVHNLWTRWHDDAAIEEVMKGGYQHKEPPAISGSGYVVRSLEAALWAFAKSQSFEEGALLAVNLGDDADTTGAIYGQLAGAFYGEHGIPKEWRDKLAWGVQIAQTGEGLLAS